MPEHFHPRALQNCGAYVRNCAACASEGFLRGPSASERRRTAVPAPATASASSHMGFYVVAYGFQSSPWCPRDHYLGRCTVRLGTSAHRPCFDLSVCLQPVCLSPDSQSDCLRFFSPPHPPLVDSLESKLWYRSGCRAAALASAAPRPLGSLFGSFSPRGARSKGDQQPDGRVAHNQKLFKPLLVSIQGLSPPVSCAQGRLVKGGWPLRVWRLPG